MLVEKQPLAKVLRRSKTSSASNLATLCPSSSSSSWVLLRSVLLIIFSPSSSSASVSSAGGSLKSPWSRRKRRHSLLARQWKGLFDFDGKLSDGGVKFLKMIRTGGVEPCLRAEVWPFLLGMYDVKSSEKERQDIRAQKRREYLVLRNQCHQICRSSILKETSICNDSDDIRNTCQILGSPSLDETSSEEPSTSTDATSFPSKLCNGDGQNAPSLSSRQSFEHQGNNGLISNEEVSEGETDSLDSDTSDDLECTKFLTSPIAMGENLLCETSDTPGKLGTGYVASCEPEDFANWQKIIRLDAIRADAEWVTYSPSQASVSIEKARQSAESVGLKDYDGLESSRIYHAARLVMILEAYALYDPEIGYCQGMSDLLSPIISVIEEDDIAFWCFVGFMRKARHNFQLDETGIKRQLSIISKIIKCKDSRLYQHLEKLQVENCFFVYRMVVVLFRRELSFEQILCLWEVMWADQAAVRAGIVKSAWRRTRLRAPPTEDLLLYAIAACVLQKRKTIIGNHCSMDELMKECNDMAGRLDVWKLLDDAHDLVTTLHHKI